MKALTLWQPWATCVAHHGKLVENRTWEPPASAIGQRIAIHAGKKLDREGYAMLLEEGIALGSESSLPRRAVIATARLAGWVRDQPSLTFRGVPETWARNEARSTWFSGPVGWLLDDVLPFEPVPCYGAQGLWKLPADIERIVLARESDAALLLP